MSTALNNIRDIFSIFHDGGIIDYKGDLNKMTLTIQCNYLAELIKPDFENFYVDLINITKLEFDPWINQIDLPKREFNNYEEFLKEDLEIISTEIKDSYVFISCYQHNTDLGYSGGNLMISAHDIKVYAHDREPMTIEQLNSICRLYWGKFGK